MAARPLTLALFALIAGQTAAIPVTPPVPTPPGHSASTALVDETPAPQPAPPTSEPVATTTMTTTATLTATATLTPTSEPSSTLSIAGTPPLLYFPIVLKGAAPASQPATPVSAPGTTPTATATPTATPSAPPEPGGTLSISGSVYVRPRWAMKTMFPNLMLFVIALSETNPLGLDQVASNPSMLYLAARPGDVAQTLSAIQSQVATSSGGACTEAGAEWIDQIDQAHTASFPSGPALPPGVYGYAYLYDKNYTPVSVPWADPRGSQQNALPITQDRPDGKLGYVIPDGSGLTPGTYFMKAFVGYKAEDSVSRQYTQIIDGGQPQQFMMFVLTPAGALGQTIVLPPLRLDLDPAVSLCT